MPASDPHRLLDRVRLGLIVIALAAAVATGVVAFAGRHGPAPTTEGGGRGAREPQARSFLALMIPPPPEAVRGTGAPTSVQELAERLPLERKVAQLLIVGFEGKRAGGPLLQALRRNDYGGVLLRRENYSSPGQIARLADAIGRTAERERHIAPFIAAEQQGGPASALEDLPPADSAASIGPPSRAEKASAESGRALEGVGVNLVLGPVLDVGGIESPVASRAFSDDADAVSEYARSAIGGYRRAGILAAPEHFPGLGAATQATDAGPASVGLSIPELIARDLRPFAAAIRSGARAVVVGHASYASDDFVTPASQSSAVIGDLLRERLGFEGLAIADDLASPAVLAHRSIPDAAIRSLRAGADMVLISESRGAQEAAYLGLLNAVRKGELSRTRLDQAVLRVLTAKERAGMIR